MERTTAARAVTALFCVCSFGTAFGAGFFPEEPNVEPEIVNIRALRQLPAEIPPRGTNMPIPQQPAYVASEGEPTSSQVAPDDATNAARSSASLWERLRAGFTLDELPSPLVREWENWYASRPDYVARMIARAERYLFYIVEEVEKRRMPAEVALLPMIESAYNPTAYSRAHASGIWQFIPSTGKTYGLRQNWWQDERRDVLAATRAALDYLEKLYEMFGSWELALASYNWGEGAVGRAVQRNESRGMKADYLSLDMPAETRNYIPKLMAVKNLVMRPEAYGLTLAEVPNRPYFAVVTTDRHIDVKLAAQLAEMPLEEFLALNPSHNRPVIRAEASQTILLPADRAERFQAKLQAHSEPLVSWQSYTIERQDSLEKIGARFGIPASELREVNGLSPGVRNLAGLTILVPSSKERSELDVAAAGFATPAAPIKTAAAAPPAKYVVRPGETLAAIAHRFGMSTAELASRNGIRNGRVLAGQTLTVESNRTAQAPQTGKARSAQVARAPAKSAQTRKASAQVKQAGSRVQVAYSSGSRD